MSLLKPYSPVSGVHFPAALVILLPKGWSLKRLQTLRSEGGVIISSTRASVPVINPLLLFAVIVTARPFFAPEYPSGRFWADSAVSRITGLLLVVIVVAPRRRWSLIVLITPIRRGWCVDYPCKVGLVASGDVVERTRLFGRMFVHFIG